MRIQPLGPLKRSRPLFRAGLGGLVLFAAGCCAFLPCDPGWHYRAIGGTAVNDNGLRFVVAGPAGTGLRVYGTLFTSMLSIELEVQNEADAPLTIRPNQLRLYDSRKTSLPRNGHSRAVACQGRESEPEVHLRSHETCKIRVDWDVRPNPKVLNHLHLVHEGIARDDKPIPVDILLDILE